MNKNFDELIVGFLKRKSLKEFSVSHHKFLHIAICAIYVIAKTELNNFISCIYRQCFCCKLTKKHHKHVLQGKSTTSCPVNPSSTNYYLVGINDDSSAFLSVTSEDDSY